jgi:DNA-binding XRE family transcriptional regulator
MVNPSLIRMRGTVLDSERIPTARMIRAARGLLNLDQVKLAKLVGVTRRTIIRLEADEGLPINPRRIEVVAAIRDTLEKDHGIRFVYADKATGEGVVMKRGR